MRRRKHAQGGGAMIEFALGAVLLVTIFTGIFQYGYTLYLYNSLENAVRAGAGYASRETYDSVTSTPSANFLNSVRNMVIYGDPHATSGAMVAPGLANANVSVVVTFAGGVPKAMTVAIHGYSLNAVFRTFTLIDKPQATMPFVGIYSPL
jgi:Flp pilus assembly protein TadG